MKREEGSIEMIPDSKLIVIDLAKSLPKKKKRSILYVLCACQLAAARFKVSC